MKLAAKLIGALLAAVGVIAVVFVAGMRAKSRPVLNSVRRVSRAMKPMMLRTAGNEGVPVSVVHHVGRTSGRAYQTPVQAVATDDGFVIALPYGPNTDWLKNVLASGTATVVDGGKTYEVSHPEVVPTESVQHHFQSADQRAHRMFRVEQSLRVRRVEVGAETRTSPA